MAIQPIRFVRTWNNKSITVRLMKKSGKLNQASRKKLSILAGPRKGAKWRLLHPRLIHMIQRVAERWPGHTIEIVSGYRPGQTGTESKHSQARAIDFRVLGIGNRELYQFCTELPRSGCGYYPNSVFIHMDVREKSAHWIDYSRPGEKSIYGPATMTASQIDAVRQKRAVKAGRHHKKHDVSSSDSEKADTGNSPRLALEEPEKEQPATSETASLSYLEDTKKKAASDKSVESLKQKKKLSDAVDKAVESISRSSEKASRIAL